MERPAGWDLVIKVKYGGILKRFGAYVYGTRVNYDMSKLRSKIISSFNLSSDAELILTYTDEDNDIVTLGDDDELRDAAISQRLNPLRINVQLKSGTGRQSDPESQTANHTPKMSPQIKNQQPQISFAVDEAMKTIPEPFRGALSKLSQDYYLKFVSFAPAFAEFMDSFSKLGLSNSKQSFSSSIGESLNTSNGAATQKMDGHISDGPKVPNDQASPYAVMPDTLITDPVSEVMQKHHESDNVHSGGMVKIPVDLNTDIPSNPHASGYPSIDDLLAPFWTETQAPIWATNDNMNHDKATCESSDAHCKGKSIISAAPLSMPSIDHTADPSSQNYEIRNPFFSPNYGITDIMSGDNSKQLPVGIGPSASNHGFNSPVDVPMSKHTPALDVPLPSAFFPIVGHPYRRSDGYHENSLRTFHRGIQCDGCGVHPIIGPRFKSNVKKDYDLCGICFSEMGNKADYTRIDRAPSTACRLYNFYNTLHNSRCRFLSSHAYHGSGMRLPRAKLQGRFIQDVTVLDGTLMPPSTPFTKIWRMRNNGTSRWPYGTRLVWVGGDHFANRRSVQLEIPVNGCSVDTEIDIAVDFTAPSRPGRYVSYWRLASPSGHKFGQRVWVLIQVDTSQSNSTGNFPTALNLNLPPENSGQNECGIIDVNAEPLNGVRSEPSLPTITSELVKPLVTEIPTKSVEPSASDAIAHPAPAVVSSVPYPLIDFPESSSDASLAAAVPPSEAVHADDNPVEQALLKELEEMGFKQIDLNKEVLRLNEYDLEQSVHDLCGYAEWDPLLAELQEMGFSDKEMNKKLLMKNGGSIKRVVLDLIAGEE